MNIIDILISVFALLGVCSFVLIIYRLCIKPNKYIGNIMSKKVSGEFKVKFAPNSSGDIEYILRRLLSFTVSPEFSKWYITIQSDDLDFESKCICEIFVENYKQIRFSDDGLSIKSNIPDQYV